MKNKTYQTKKVKKDNTLHIVVDQTKLPNKLHFETQLKTKLAVFADRRYKKPKHKGKIFDE